MNPIPVILHNLDALEFKSTILSSERIRLHNDQINTIGQLHAVGYDIRNLIGKIKL